MNAVRMALVMAAALAGLWARPAAAQLLDAPVKVRPCNQVACSMDNVSLDGLRCCKGFFQDPLKLRQWVNRALSNRDPERAFYVLRFIHVSLSRDQLNLAAEIVVDGGMLADLVNYKASWSELEMDTVNHALIHACKKKKAVPSGAWERSSWKSCEAALDAEREIEANRQAGVRKIPTPDQILGKKGVKKHSSLNPPPDIPGIDAPSPRPPPASEAPAAPAQSESFSAVEAALPSKSPTRIAAALKAEGAPADKNTRELAVQIVLGGKPEQLLVLLQVLGPEMNGKQRASAIENYIAQEGDLFALMKSVALTPAEAAIIVDSATSPGDAAKLKAIPYKKLR